jgi:hypothetical protein
MKEKKRQTKCPEQGGDGKEESQAGGWQIMK